ncbi:MAG: hypothetical protein KME13_23760 [Myxacorys californica WJT36-NPBG1]|jgi:hypothetical protein|nr:hypothetical protein [Myxacorys californica WJT36-NPBG1]
MPKKSHLERSLETLVDLSEMSRKSTAAGFDRMTAAIEALTLNVGQMASQQRYTTASIDRLIEGVTRLEASVERQNAAIDGHLRLSEAQAANIAELTRLATRLIDQRTA